MASGTTVEPGSSNIGRLTSWKESILSRNKVAKMSFTLIFSHKNIIAYFPFFLNPLLSVSLFLFTEATTSTGVIRTSVVEWKIDENYCVCVCENFG